MENINNYIGVVKNQNLHKDIKINNIYITILEDSKYYLTVDYCIENENILKYNIKSYFQKIYLENLKIKSYEKKIYYNDNITNILHCIKYKILK
ncbi:hypothetical protein AMV218 [Betaentomopoxvirus amoorei]|uniref:AMV218 n=1 Tax=Amsacta moorei entomopoxvirus TaxID=28321 RepID=Q9EMI8_AMEPV|nr:hypothetical protein AMV218 [Amsacta moorei entomopoxvirus]AAG02924.1 AMV218 [Amsacta moorei entomopoxvirus]